MSVALPPSPAPAEPPVTPPRADDGPAAQIGCVLLPGFGALALAGLHEVLMAANGLLGQTRYQSCLLSVAGPPVAAAGGLAVVTRPLAEAPPLGAVFVIADESPARDPGLRAALLPWLQARAAEGIPMGGLGGGAAWLAEAGLLRGHRATAHWPQIAALAESHVDTVFSHHCYEIDRGRLTAAGHGASQDLLIAWLGLRHGERFTQELVAALGLERLRPRDERQRIPSHARLGGGSAKLAEAVSLMEANLGEPLPTEDIARLVGVSRRQLERLFKQHLDALPSRWYVALRLARARRLLQQTSQSILQIGLSCGFASGPHFSNAYRAHFGHTPRDERSQRAAAWRQGGSEAGEGGSGPPPGPGGPTGGGPGRLPVAGPAVAAGTLTDAAADTGRGIGPPTARTPAEARPAPPAPSPSRPERRRGLAGPALESA